MIRSTWSADGDTSAEHTVEPRTIQLDSGNRVVVHTAATNECVEICAPQGKMLMRIRLTEDGPAVELEGAHLALKACETLSLEAKEVKIQAAEKATLQSGGTLAVQAKQQMDIQSDDDVKVVGEKIYLN